MSFFKTLFSPSDKPSAIQEKKDPENTRLNYLLNIWEQYSSNENYKAVLDEILNGNSFLLLPSLNDGETIGWTTTKTGDILKFTSVFNLDGLKVLGAFSDEQSLFKWAKKPTQYTGIETKKVIEICGELGIDRIVINSDQKNMFVLERNRNNFQARTIEERTPAKIGRPIKPLDKRILDKLVLNFKKVDTIQEAYHYALSYGDEFSLVIDVLLSVDSDNSRAALYNAINDSLGGEKMDTPVDISVIPTEDSLNSIRNIDNSLFYKRSS